VLRPDTKAVTSAAPHRMDIDSSTSARTPTPATPGGDADSSAWTPIRYRCRHGLSGTTAAAEPGRPRTLYLREDRLLRDITAALRPELANGDVAVYLRSRHVGAVCTRESMTIERD
jgi:hypothetical protein